jgi:hypothetical protein
MEFQGVVTDEKRGYRERDAEQNRLDHNRDGYFTVDLPPDAMFEATATKTTVSGIPCILFAAGNDELARFSFPKPSLWRSGYIKVEMLYATNGTDADSADVDLTVRGQEYNTILSSGVTTLYTASEQFTVDGTANKMFLHTITTTTKLTDDMKFIHGIVDRQGVGDSNSDGFNLFDMRFTFLPDKRQ